MIDNEDLTDVVAEILDGLVETMPSIPAVQPVPSPCSFIRGSVDVVGGRPMTFVVQISAATGMNLTSNWTGIDPDDLTLEDACNTVAELSNILAGAAKTLIPEETALSIPVASIVIDDDPMAIAFTTVEHLLGSFDVAIAN